MQKWLLSTALLASACGSRGGGGSAPAAMMSSSPQAVSAFMRAAADSNLSRMAELWGNERGPASQTHYPDDFEKRLIVLQVWLRGDSTRVMSDDPIPGEENQRRVGLALYRGTCVKQIPATTVRTRDGGWIVNRIDITFAGNPARPCEP